MCIRDRDAMVEQNHRIRDVFLESLPGEKPLAALTRDDGSDTLLLQPAEQPSQLGAENPVVLQPREQRFDGVEDHPLGADRADRITEADKPVSYTHLRAHETP